jgi:hypothetical protein
VKTEAHDFGGYRELYVQWLDERGCNMAHDLEGDLPCYWDEPAQDALGMSFHDTLWTCEICERSLKTNGNGDRALMDKDGTIVEQCEDGSYLSIEGELDGDELPLIDDGGDSSKSRSVCPECQDEHYVSCDNCDSLVHKDHVMYMEESAVCSDDCYCQVEQVEGDERWRDFGESDSEAFLAGLIDPSNIMEDDDRNALVYRFREAHEEAWQVLKDFFYYARGYYSEWRVPRNVAEIKAVLDEAAVDRLLEPLPPKCTDCEADCRWWDTRGFRRAPETFNDLQDRLSRKKSA